MNKIGFYEATISLKQIHNVFRTDPIIKPEKLPVHDSLVGLAVELWLNRWRYKYIFYILLKFLKIISSMWILIVSTLFVEFFHFLFLHQIVNKNHNFNYKIKESSH